MIHRIVTTQPPIAANPKNTTLITRNRIDKRIPATSKYGMQLIRRVIQCINPMKIAKITRPRAQRNRKNRTDKILSLFFLYHVDLTGSNIIPINMRTKQ